MAKAHIALASANGRATTGATLQLPDSQLFASVTSTGSDDEEDVLTGEVKLNWIVEAIEGDFYFACGESPDPTQNPRWHVKEGSRVSCAVTETGEKIKLLVDA